VKLNDFVSTSPFISLQFTQKYDIKDGNKSKEAENTKMIAKTIKNEKSTIKPKNGFIVDFFRNFQKITVIS